jgi:predicted MFS family arabinose efflux permease
MVAADLGRALLLASVPVAALAGALSLWQLYTVALGTGALTVFFNVTSGSYLPSLVERRELSSANSRLMTSFAMAQVGGPGLAGLLVQLLSAPIAVAVDAVSFVVSAALVARIHAAELPRDRAERRAAWREMGEGLRELVASRPMLAISASAATLNLFGVAMEALQVLYVTRWLGFTAWMVGAMMASLGLGGVAGAVAAGWVARRIGQGRAIVAATGWFSVGLILLPTAGGPPWVAFAIVAGGNLLFGVAVMVFDVNVAAFRQSVTPPRLLGRVGASMSFITQGAKPLGALLGGVLGAALGLREALWLLAAGGAGSVIWTWLSPLRRGGHGVSSH